MADDAAVTAATSFLSIRTYIESRYGTGSFRRVREAVVERGFADFPAVLLPTAKYPTAMLFATIEAARDVLGPEDFYEGCGRGIVEYEVNVFLRFAMKLASPRGILDHATEAWRKVHSTGEWNVTGPDGAAAAELIGFVTTEGYCRMLVAYFLRLLELTGARGVGVKHVECRARGAKSCRYLATWKTR